MLHSSSSTTTETGFTDFETFLRQEGYFLNIAPEEARERMRTAFSPASLERFEELMELRQQRPYKSEELYAVIDTLPEAALLFSPQSHVSSACGQQLQRKLKPLLSPGMNVADMGCGVGSWTRWMSQHFPNVKFAAIDRHDGLLSIASTAETAANCQFMLADYSELSSAYGSFDVVASLLGIDFEPSMLAPDRESLSALDPTCNTICEYFQRVASGAFSGWKRVLREGGTIMAVLRLPNFESWYGCLAAARDAGLRFDAEASSCVAVGKQRFPLLVLQPTQKVEALDLDALLHWWVERTGASAEAQVLVDSAALWRYRRLKDKKVLEESETQYEDGHFLRRETGLATGVGYIYEYATTMYRRLECISEERLNKGSQLTFTEDL